MRPPIGEVQAANKVGPRTDPCGMPDEHDTGAEEYPPSVTNLERLLIGLAL